jgi:hypothetical protein
MHGLLKIPKGFPLCRNRSRRSSSDSELNTNVTEND